MAGVLSAVVTYSMTGCGAPIVETNAVGTNLPPSGTDCGEWEWEDGQWECDDYDSGHYGYYFHNGKFYRNTKIKSKSRPITNSDANSKPSSSTINSSSSGKTSSGFGKSSSSGGYTGG